MPAAAALAFRTNASRPASAALSYRQVTRYLKVTCYTARGDFGRCAFRWVKSEACENPFFGCQGGSSHVCLHKCCCRAPSLLRAGGASTGLLVAPALSQFVSTHSSACRRDKLIKQLKQSVLPEIERTEKQGANGAVAGTRACTRLCVRVHYSTFFLHSRVRQ